MGGMGRTRDNDYYLIKIEHFSKKEGFYKPFVVLILSCRQIKKDYFFNCLTTQIKRERRNDGEHNN